MNILLIGGSGKMGRMIKENIKPPFFITRTMKEGDDRLPDLSDIDAVLDFSKSEATIKYLPQLAKMQIPYIIGTTGFKMEQREYMKDLANKEKTHIRLVSNFDPTFSAFASTIYSLKGFFKRAIVEEWHQISKRDIPSGSAKTLVEILNPLQTSVIVHRTRNFCYKHQITLIDSNKEIRLIHLIKDKVVYLRGIIQALNSSSLIGFFEGL